jgi:hypothetical protein
MFKKRNFEEKLKMELIVRDSIKKRIKNNYYSNDKPCLTNTVKW